MSRWPIRLRVTAACALAMAVVLAASGWFLYARLGSHLDTSLNNQLHVRADDLAALVQQPKGSLRSDGRARLVEPGESYAQLIDRNGHVVDATPPLGTRAVVDADVLRTASVEATFADLASVPGLDEPSRVLAVPVVRAGQPLVLVVGATKQNRAETLASFRNELLIAGPIALVLASVLGYLLAGLSLRQVESMRRRAAAISADTPDRRLPVPPTGDELERLGTTLNEMLDRLEDGLERERGFVADAGHELRTPLALLRTELELALRHGTSAEELRTAVRASSTEVERLSQLADDLLLIARSERGKLDLKLETIDADELVDSVATRFQWRAEESGRSIVRENGAHPRVQVDRLRVEQALANLLDNALRHGSGTVRLGARSTESQVEIHVQDDGGGFPSAFLEQAFERFTRPPHTGRAGAGSGLGLSIVRAIAEAHGGTARAANTTDGGADVWLVLPLAPAGTLDRVTDAPRDEHEVVCPHCKKPFTAELLPGSAERYRGFKCPHCKLFVPAERAVEQA